MRLPARRKVNEMTEDYRTYDVFLSYSHRDEHIAQELAARLRSAGLHCFLAASDLTPGDNWKAEIRHAIRCSDKVLLLITPRSKSSDWVALETGAAWMEEKEFIPLTLFVGPEELGEIPKEYQVHVIETEEQKLELVNHLKASRMGPQLSFPDMLFSIETAVARMDNESFNPDIVIGSGRDGAICGGIFAQLFRIGRLKMVTLFRPEKPKIPTRRIDAKGISEDDVKDKSVLVVEWARKTGRTFSAINDYICALGPAELKFFAMFWCPDSQGNRPDYYAFRQPSPPLSPWADQKARKQARTHPTE